MSFNLELPDVEEVKEKVAEELAVTDERQQTVDETAKQKVEEIMGTDISVFEDRKNLTTAFEEFGADKGPAGAGGADEEPGSFHGGFRSEGPVRQDFQSGKAVF